MRGMMIYILRWLESMPSRGKYESLGILSEIDRFDLFLVKSKPGYWKVCVEPVNGRRLAPNRQTLACWLSNSDMVSDSH